MSGVGVMRAGEYIGARELRLRLAQVMKSPKAFFVTEHGKPVKAMVPYAAFLELLEMVDELKDASLAHEVREGRAEYAAGRWRSLAGLRRSFGARG